VKRIVPILLLLVLAGAEAPIAPPPPQQPASPFTTIDVYIDPRGTPMAAYQFELRATDGLVSFVGVEKGDIPGFQDPPYYDAASTDKTRIVVGAFNVGGNLPNRKSRMVRLHVHVEGDVKPKYTVKLMTAGDADGKPIPADVTFTEGERR
jgi:hypothetical protein